MKEVFYQAKVGKLYVSSLSEHHNFIELRKQHVKNLSKKELDFLLKNIPNANVRKIETVFSEWK